MNTAKVITSGNISEEAQAWLLSHECTIETSLGLSIILLSIEAEVERGQYDHEYTIAFYDEEKVRSNTRFALFRRVLYGFATIPQSSC